MPFTFQPLQVKREGSELELRGRLLTGAYFGPELVVVRSKDGNELDRNILGHSMEYPDDWPVLPEHSNTILILHIHAVPPDFEPALLTGVGSVAPGTERIDITDALVEPEFWAMQANLHFASEDVDDPGLEWLGVESDSANDWYESRIKSHILVGRWPYVRVALPSSRFIELEMACDVEYQDRIWIGQQTETHRVLLGYHSGHFSLPALRATELSLIATETDFGASNLLWLSATYLDKSADFLALTERFVSQVPGLLRSKRAAMSETILNNMVVEDLQWTHDPSIGWINNWRYSQRNPASGMSILKPEDFAYIQQFFP